MLNEHEMTIRPINKTNQNNLAWQLTNAEYPEIGRQFKRHNITEEELRSHRHPNHAKSFSIWATIQNKRKLLEETEMPEFYRRALEIILGNQIDADKIEEYIYISFIFKRRNTDRRLPLRVLAGSDVVAMLAVFCACTVGVLRWDFAPLLVVQVKLVVISHIFFFYHFGRVLPDRPICPRVLSVSDDGQCRRPSAPLSRAPLVYLCRTKAPEDQDERSLDRQNHPGDAPGLTLGTCQQRFEGLLACEVISHI